MNNQYNLFFHKVDAWSVKPDWLLFAALHLRNGSDVLLFDGCCRDKEPTTTVGLTVLPLLPAHPEGDKVDFGDLF